MALPLTHGAAAYAIYEAMRPAGTHRPWLAVAAIALANAPDLDFLPGLLIGEPHRFHRGVSHTMGGVTGVVLLTWVIAGWGRLDERRRSWWAAFVGSAWSSHLFLDYLAHDVVPPYGGQFLWPLSNAYFLAPLPIIPEIIVPESAGGFFWSLVAPEAWPVWAWEMAAMLVVCGLAFGYGRMRDGAVAARRELAE